MAYRILHVSDLHTGPPFRQTVADTLVTQAHTIKPDLVVVSGDFVQRADFVAQWRAACALREALPQPQLVVPGNHDVPLFHLHLRLFNPLGRYRRYVTTELNPVFELPGLVVVGANTAHGLTSDGGRLSRTQRANLRRILARYGPEVYKVVVWHHPVANPPGARKDRVMRGASSAMHVLDEHRVGLLLTGHLHTGYVGHTRTMMPQLEHGTIICQSGTTMSSRGHGHEKGQNSCNLITIDEQFIQISQLLYQAEVKQFVPVAEYRFPRI